MPIATGNGGVYGGGMKTPFDRPPVVYDHTRDWCNCGPTAQGVTGRRYLGYEQCSHCLTLLRTKKIKPIKFTIKRENQAWEGEHGAE